MIVITQAAHQSRRYWTVSRVCVSVMKRLQLRRDATAIRPPRDFHASNESLCWSCKWLQQMTSTSDLTSDLTATSNYDHDTRASVSQNIIDEAMEKGVTRVRDSERISFGTFARLKRLFQRHHSPYYTTGSFQSHHLPGKYVNASRHFRRCYLKANKVNKSEGTRKDE